MVGGCDLVRACYCGRDRGLNVSRKKRPGGAIIYLRCSVLGQEDVIRYPLVFDTFETRAGYLINISPDLQ